MHDLPYMYIALPCQLLACLHDPYIIFVTRQKYIEQRHPSPSALPRIVARQMIIRAWLEVKG